MSNKVYRVPGYELEGVIKNASIINTIRTPATVFFHYRVLLCITNFRKFSLFIKSDAWLTTAAN
jgi:hypothetical protein